MGRIRDKELISVLTSYDTPLSSIISGFSIALDVVLLPLLSKSLLPFATSRGSEGDECHLISQKNALKKLTNLVSALANLWVSDS